MCVFYVHNEYVHTVRMHARDSVICLHVSDYSLFLGLGLWGGGVNVRERVVGRLKVRHDAVQSE